MDITPTREQALRRLNAFLPYAADHYTVQRNYDEAPEQRTTVSQLSPYIRHGLLSERELVQAVLQRHSFSDAGSFIQQVCWRGYWKGWLELRPAAWQDYQATLREQQAALQTDPTLSLRYHAAIAGDTGIACCDIWIRELIDTGYLHNHARMWFASIWIFTLQLPWSLGADFFMQHLLDADAACNTLSWRWVAGLHTPGKRYLASAHNIAKYTRGCHSPGGLLVKEAAPLVDATVYLPRSLPPPARLIPSRRSLLLVHDEAVLGPELDLSGLDLKAIVALRSRSTAASSAGRFREGALTEGLRLLRDRTGLPGRIVEPDQLAGAVAELDLEQVVSAHVPVGPLSNSLIPVVQTLTATGINWVPVMRSWDRLLWPHATRGYFAFSQQVLPIVLKLMDDADRTARTSADEFRARKLAVDCEIGRGERI